MTAKPNIISALIVFELLAYVSGVYIHQWIIRKNSVVSNRYKGHLTYKFTKAYFKVKKNMTAMCVLN